VRRALSKSQEEMEGLVLSWRGHQPPAFINGGGTPMKRLKALALCALVFLGLDGLSLAQTSATLTLPSINGAQGDVVAVPIQVSTDSIIGLAQFVVEYNSTILRFENTQVGSGVSGFSISLVNADLPFSPTTPGTDDNVLVQASGGGTASFRGTDVEVVVLNFTVIGPSGNSPLAFDRGTNKTFLTTVHLKDLTSTSLTFVDGTLTVTTDVEVGEEITLPKTFELFQNYPNPFNPATTIRFAVPQGLKEGVSVSLRIFNVRGQVVRILVEGEKPPGFYSVVWDGRDDRGQRVSPGLYLYTLSAGPFKATRKMILLK